MAYKIQELEGIGAVKAARFEAVGIKTTDDLLERCGSASGRTALAKETEFTAAELLRCANMCDLMRISGVGEEYSDLLEAAGVDTVKELRNRNAANLTAAMAAKNEEKKLVRAVPSESKVTDWIEQAKGMEPKITH